MSESVWNWLYDYLDEAYQSGHEEIADKLESFSSLAYEKDQKGVEALFPELLAFARSQDNKWLEVFLRHWRIQAYIYTNCDQRKLVPDVLELLAFCNDEDVRSCPQSTCVIDDMVAVYESIDSKGYAPEIDEMVTETLQGLSPKIECFQCMTLCKVSALTDLGKPAEALEFFRLNSLESPKLFSEDYYYTHLAPTVVEAYLENAQYKLAAELLEKCRPDSLTDLSAVACLKVIAHIKMNKTAIAEDLMLDLSGKSFLDTDTRMLIQAARSFKDIPHAPIIMKQALYLAKNCLETGRVREAFDAASLAFDIGKSSFNKDVCQDSLAIMEKAIPDLNRPLGADKTLQTARAISLTYLKSF